MQPCAGGYIAFPSGREPPWADLGSEVVEGQAVGRGEKSQRLDLTQGTRDYWMANIERPRPLRTGTRHGNLLGRAKRSAPRAADMGRSPLNGTSLEDGGGLTPSCKRLGRLSSAATFLVVHFECTLSSWNRGVERQNASRLRSRVGSRIKAPCLPDRFAQRCDAVQEPRLLVIHRNGQRPCLLGPAPETFRSRRKDCGGCHQAMLIQSHRVAAELRQGVRRVSVGRQDLDKRR